MKIIKELCMPRDSVFDDTTREDVLNLSDEVSQRVSEILEIADDEGLGNGRSPLGIVGGAIYIAGLEFGEKRSQRDIADVIGVSEVTIRKRCAELEELVGL